MLRIQNALPKRSPKFRLIWVAATARAVNCKACPCPSFLALVCSFCWLCRCFNVGLGMRLRPGYKRRTTDHHKERPLPLQLPVLKTSPKTHIVERRCSRFCFSSVSPQILAPTADLTALNPQPPLNPELP